MPAQPPNILFILSDQHNAKVLGHAGHPDVKTPHLDRLAAQGVRFTAAVCQNPICTPSRVSFLSGQYPHNHGHYGLSGPNPGGLPSIFSHLRRHGYRTAAIGKIHCPEGWVESATDVFHDTCDTSVGGRSKDYESFLRSRGKLELEDHIRMPEFGARGTQSMEGRVSPLSFEESQEGWTTDQSIAFMRSSAEARQPFVIQASLPRPHQCTAPSEPFWSMYDGRGLTLPPNADDDLRAGKQAPHLIAAAARWRRGAWALIEPKTFEAARRRKLQGYLGAVSQVDHAVGRLLEFLRSSGLEENTIVVYSSDHGDYACEHGIMEKAPGIGHDAITRVPFLWRWPGRFKAGHVVSDVVETIDLSTTLCALAGVEPMATSDGADLSTMLSGGAGDPQRLGLTEFAWSKSIRQGHWRMVWYPRAMFPAEYPDGFGELYDLSSDPWERNNLYFEPAHQVKVRSLRHELLDWLVRTSRPVTSLEVCNGAQPPRPDMQRGYRAWTNADGKISPSDLQQKAGNHYL